MRPITIVAGPLTGASTTKVGGSQTVPAANALVIDGTGSGYSVNSIATSQSVSGASTVVINGARAISGVAYLVPAAQVVITSASNDSGITFTVAGLAPDNVTAQTQTITGSNSSRTATTKLFGVVNSITTSGSTAGNIQVGVNGVMTLDHARRVLFTSSGTDTGITFTVTGFDVANNPQSEVLTGGSNGSPVYTVLDYLTVSSIVASGASAGTVSVGTNGIAGSAWVRLDDWAMSQVAIQATVSGTINYTLQQTLDDPNDPSSPVAESSITWVNSSDSAVVSATATAQSNYAYAPKMARVLVNSGSGTVTVTYTQALSAVV